MDFENGLKFVHIHWVKNRSKHLTKRYYHSPKKKEWFEVRSHPLGKKQKNLLSLHQKRKRNGHFLTQFKPKLPRTTFHPFSPSLLCFNRERVPQPRNNDDEPEDANTRDDWITTARWKKTDQWVSPSIHKQPQFVWAMKKVWKWLITVHVNFINCN